MAAGDLEGLSALVTGATSGIGEAIAREAGPGGEAAADVDVLVNNAGFAWYGATDQLDAETFDALFAVNVRAPYLLVAAAGPAMAARGSGSIINIGSRAGRIGRSGGAAYSATKAALASLTRTWAAEFSPAGVRVNTVAPGPVETGAAPDELIAALAATTIMGRAARPEEIAPLVAFLASPKSGYITGALYDIDGGSRA